MITVVYYNFVFCSLSNIFNENVVAKQTVWLKKYSDLLMRLNNVKKKSLILIQNKNITKKVKC